MWVNISYPCSHVKRLDHTCSKFKHMYISYKIFDKYLIDIYSHVVEFSIRHDHMWNHSSNHAASSSTCVFWHRLQLFTCAWSNCTCGCVFRSTCSNVKSPGKMSGVEMFYNRLHKSFQFLMITGETARSHVQSVRAHVFSDKPNVFTCAWQMFTCGILTCGTIDQTTCTNRSSKCEQFHVVSKTHSTTLLSL